MVEGSGVIGEVGLEDVEVSIPVVVADGGTHAGLLAPVLVEGDACVGGAIGEGPVMVVAVENGGRGIAGHVDVKPAVLLGVHGGTGGAGVAGGFCGTAFCGHGR